MRQSPPPRPAISFSSQPEAYSCETNRNGLIQRVWPYCSTLNFLESTLSSRRLALRIAEAIRDIGLAVPRLAVPSDDAIQPLHQRFAKEI